MRGDIASPCRMIRSFLFFVGRLGFLILEWCWRWWRWRRRRGLGLGGGPLHLNAKLSRWSLGM
jgi:hypothetical protein